MFRVSVSRPYVDLTLPLQWTEPLRTPVVRTVSDAGDQHDRVRNSIGWRERLASLRGSCVDLDLRGYDEPLAEIGRLADEIQRASDEEIDARVRAIRAEVRGGAGVDRVRVPFFALVREVSSRVIALRPFDVQVVAALALDRGAIVEMQTGEGKTLAAVMPVALNALSGHGVHVLTFNDYLARRDAEWMAPVYTRLGLSVGFVQHDMTAADRRRAYLADVTYVTAKEAGFDHLRDLLARDMRDLVHRPFHFALVDEADSLLIDEARVPLVIAGSVDRGASSAGRLAEIVRPFMPGIHFDLDEYGRNAALTERGIEQVERVLGCGSLHEEKNYALLSELNCALHAQVLLRRDVDYLVRDGRIGIIDELTGRVVADRHWPDGLQAALEAKERIERQADGRILGSVTLQHFVGGYPRLCGMTGTAQAAAAELHDMYGLGVVVIPTHRAMIRIDRPDLVFSDRETKERALIDEIRRVHASGRPVLVGTLTVEESERLAARLRAAGVTCQILNAKNDAAEARIVAAAGALGAVTISTNMAGRGTDIRLGGVDEATREQVVALGGLYVIGTNRHESLRVDLQLRGRAGRQGDPGESRFFISLEDDLLVRYGLRNLLAGRFANDAGPDPIEHPVVVHEVARAQRIVDGQNVEIRKTLWRYATVLEKQRRTLMQWRRAVLEDPERLDVWQRSPEARAALAAAAGEESVRRAEQAVTLHHIDRAWCDHLSRAADLREGIHLVSLGGQDPLARFTGEITLAFQRLHEAVEEGVLEALADVRVADGTIDLAPLDIKGPSSTWTYLVNDDAFRHQIGMLLTGPGRATFAIGAALFAMPLLMLWGLVDRYLGRRRRRRPDPWQR
jgi:preprotein translocase subunit SecA